MKSNELRIGNLVKDRGDKILRIDWFEINKVCQKQILGNFEVHPLTEYIEYLKPIELTKEFLLKIGFKKRFDDTTCNLYDFENYKENTLNCTNEGQGYICIADFKTKHGWFLDLQTRVRLKYVHQLQNLYFALTGEELQILP